VTVAPPDHRLPFAAALLTSVVAGLVLGVVDLIGQLNLPYPWADLANSAAVWSLAAFVLGWRLRLDAARGAACGALFLVVAVEAYYLATIVGLGDSAANLTSATTVLWLVLGIGAGALAGIAGSLVASANPASRLSGAALAAGVVVVAVACTA
jgi:hypothetical protein